VIDLQAHFLSPLLIEEKSPWAIVDVDERSLICECFAEESVL
jgi:hypothetical protein